MSNWMETIEIAANLIGCNALEEITGSAGEIIHANGFEEAG